MAIRFESKKEGSEDKSTRKAAEAKARVVASAEQSVDAANAPEMPFAKPVRPLKKKQPK